MASLNKEIMIYADKKKLAGLAVLCLLLVYLGVSIILAYPRMARKDPLMLITGWSCLPVFGTCAFLFIYRLFTRKPLLIINQKGLTDNASILEAGLIPWEEIERVFPYVFFGMNFLGIELKKPEALLARQKGIKWFLMRVNQSFMRAPINIPQIGLMATFEEILGKVEQYIH